MNVVSIMAHQDDEMQCLGTMLKCRSRGDRLFFVVLTDGSKGFCHRPTITPEEAARIRNEEMNGLACQLNAVYLNLQEPDEFLYDTKEVRLKLIEAIRRTRAELIFTHYYEDYNQDHATVATLVKHCAMQAALPVIATESQPLADYPAIFMARPHGFLMFPVTHLVDVHACEEEKIALAKFHRSQEEAMEMDIEGGQGLGGVVRMGDAYWGEQADCGYAEAFTPMRARGAIKPYNVLP